MRLDAFHPDYRRFIRELTSCSAALEDLADSFPGLLFALATNYATADQRERAFEIDLRWRCRCARSRRAGLPWWLRKLPPHAFATPLPVVSARPGIHVPHQQSDPARRAAAADWLTHVGHACEASGPAYALWIARQADLTDPLGDMFRVMAAWAWFSQHHELPGHRLLRRPGAPT